MKVQLTASGFELTSELEKYADSKALALGRLVPRKLRAEASCHIEFVQVKRGAAKYNTCSITFMLDDTELKAEETTLHMFAALDIALVHIEQELEDYVGRQHKHRRLRLRRYPRAD